MPMKISTHIKIAVMALLLVVAVQAREDIVPQSWKSGATTVTLSPDGTLRIKGKGAMEDYVFLTGDPPWYGVRSLITGLVIENGVTHIGERAFTNCAGLTSVAIPGSVASIGEEAFDGCTGLASVTIPRGVKSIGSLAFDDRTSITIAADNVHYKYVNGVLLPAKQSWKSGETTVTLNGGTLRVSGKGAMGDYSHSRHGNPTSWHHVAFAITGLVIEDGVTHIGSYAFSGLSGLKSVTISNSVTSIGSYAFRGAALTSVAIPGSVKLIGEVAFGNCAGLTSVTISDGVTAIGAYAFQGTGLTSVAIPGSVTSIGFLVFDGCANLTSITIAADNPRYSSEDGVLFNKSKTVLIQYPAGKPGAYAIPGSVKSIGDLAFYGCTGLTSVTIPGSVTSIGMGAFSDCAGLTSVAIPNSVTSIGDVAFAHCTGLTSVTIPGSVAKIRKGRSGGMRGIGEYAFYGCTGLKSVVIEDGVRSIGREMFAGCTSLTSVTIPGSVMFIGAVAFSGCNLTSVTIGDGATSMEIGYYAFGGINRDSACLYVPAGSINACRRSEVWKEFNCIKPIAPGEISGETKAGGVPWFVLGILAMILFAAIFIIMKKSQMLKVKEP